MKLARLTCPGCRSAYEAAVAQGAYFAQCPNCGQNNNVPLGAPLITGRCERCDRPLDDHQWLDGAITACP
jgi:hypothetical protein